MNFAIKQYIDLNLPPDAEAIYNKPIWQQSVFDGAIAGHLVNIALNKNEERAFILVHEIALGSRTGVAIVVNYWDLAYSPKRPIFIYSGTSFGIFQFIYLAQANSLRISNDQDVSFSLLYQTISLRKKK
jgi:hypothetical protein